jgi:hypothetical protein
MDIFPQGGIMAKRKIDSDTRDCNHKRITASKDSILDHCEFLQRTSINITPYHWKKPGRKPDPFAEKDSFPHCLYYFTREANPEEYNG